ncbi:MAG: peptidoglycan DD-metalloendopeptidase family protein [Saprospiraceae bacterium]|nr:peptidoglycan DD-metalloendopeptidase family protein [Saprospiraceae bacterium]
MQLNRFFAKSLHLIAFSALLVVNVFLLRFLINNNFLSFTQSDVENCAPSTHLYGFDTELFSFQTQKIKQNQLFPQILSGIGLNSSKVSKVMQNIDGYINMKNIRAGNDYTLVYSNECTHPDYLLYELDPSKILICDLNGNSCPQLIQKTTEVKRESAFGTIKSSLWKALEESGVSGIIIDQMEDALATSVDFLHIQEGSSFRLIFDRIWIDGEPSSNGTLLAAYFNTGNNEHHAIRFENNGKFDYYDLNGRPLRRCFLQAPLRFSRISSGFSQRRFHPVLKYSKPHFGTDYAAPIGTPIMSVGNGIVTAASYTGGNGKFVKIRHDQTYETQYLHMSRFANGIKPGTSVSQGQVIGYVGMSGLATGPHVCFRFWKNGVQVDHRKLKFPSGDPLPKELLQNYLKYKDTIITTLNTIQGPAAMLLPSRESTRS